MRSQNLVKIKKRYSAASLVEFQSQVILQVISRAQCIAGIVYLEQLRLNVSKNFHNSTVKHYRKHAEHSP